MSTIEDQTDSSSNWKSILSDKDIKAHFVNRNRSIANPDIGYDSVSASSVKNQDNQMKRSERLKDYLKFIKSKVDVFNSFLELISNKQFEIPNLELFIDIFKPIRDFFHELYEILQPLLTNNTPDCCFSIDIWPLYRGLKTSFKSYNSKCNSAIAMIARINKENIVAKDVFHQFASQHKMQNINYFMQMPKRTMSDSEAQLNGIIKLTSWHHPDLKFLDDIIALEKSVSELLNTTEATYNEGENQLLVIKCIGNPVISSPHACLCVCLSVCACR